MSGFLAARRQPAWLLRFTCRLQMIYNVTVKKSDNIFFYAGSP